MPTKTRVYWYPEGMESDTPRQDRNLRVQNTNFEKLSELALDLGLTKKRMAERCIDLSYRLNQRLNGHLKLLFDPRAKIKVYFDDDHRVEVQF